MIFKNVLKIWILISSHPWTLKISKASSSSNLSIIFNIFHKISILINSHPWNLKLSKTLSSSNMSIIFKKLEFSSVLIRKISRFQKPHHRRICQLFSRNFNPHQFSSVKSEDFSCLIIVEFENSKKKVPTRIKINETKRKLKAYESLTTELTTKLMKPCASKMKTLFVKSSKKNSRFWKHWGFFFFEFFKMEFTSILHPYSITPPGWWYSWWAHIVTVPYGNSTFCILILIW